MSSTGIDPFFLYEFSNFQNKYGRCDLDLQDIKKILKTVWQMFPSTHLPNFIQISSAVSEKQGRDKANTG
jgi:hypothetical protein